ncbi:uncharacterized protein LOC128679292 isoform X2 [Plodia interpunctella]|uniref:uncharacterized protein LOC128679292 isoform X2 n=1 Tax=Plodia interpunctella TaxID=58824 RepID=UPI002368C981|nr:uncharacterized protein LOC128679292 isoform X2 [Plodia interpunctella]
MMESAQSNDCNRIRDVENADSVEVNAEASPTAVNSLILDYYKKFGRKRDLEQYFSLSTAHGEIRDPTGLFWRRMKSQNESSDSGDKKSESSTELCRISIKCSLPEQSPSSQEEESKDKSASVSPPIITEDATKYSDGEDSVKSDNHSQKSIDLALDTSINKPFSPTSSITSQRKLEWDSLADVGYGNESDRKTSASSLSTLERLALKQQYSNNDTKKESDLGPPTAHSTFLDQSENKSKGKRGNTKKTSIHNRDIDLVEVDLPQSNCHQAISVNLTKHISFNVEKDGVVSLGNIKKDLSVTPEKESECVVHERKDPNNTKDKTDASVTPENVAVETEVTPHIRHDKEIQTTLTKDKGTSSANLNTMVKPVYVHKVPVLINLNSLKKRNKRRKLKTVKKRLKSRKKLEVDKENLPAQEKSGAQVSEAESFEYMPGHMYNQNQNNFNQSNPKFSSFAGNKSSLESSGALTTDSSKTSIHSFTKDLKKSIDLLRAALKHRYDDSTLKKQLIKDVVKRLIKSNYRDDDTTTDFLSGLSFHSKKIGLSEGHTTTSSNSDGNQTREKLPKKSILRLDRFNSNVLASTSQSAPNLPVASASEKSILSKVPKVLTSSNTESDVSSEKKSSDAGFAKTSSEELYQKYLVALRREETYKRHLKDKENFLRQKLVSSDTAFKLTSRPDLKANSKLQDLLKDLTRNNYDDGSGDASKLEGGGNSNAIDNEHGFCIKNQRSHSVFTLSSANSDSCPHRKNNLKKRLQQEMKESRAGSSKDGLCQCGNLHIKGPKIDVADSSVQVNIQNTSNVSSVEQKKQSKNEEEIKYVCLCADQNVASQGIPPNMYIYKCSRISDHTLNSQSSATCNVQCGSTVNTTNYRLNQPSTSKDREDWNDNRGRANFDPFANARRNSQPCPSSVNMAFHVNCQGANTLSSDNKNNYRVTSNKNGNQNIFVHEATRSVQTEISINTAILEPCLRDINIVSDTDCCRVVNECYKMVSKGKSDNDFNNSPECSAEGERSGTCVIHEKHVAAKDSQTDFNLGIRSTISSIARTLEKEVQSDIETNVDRILDKGEDNFTIPIKGTNMTLLVSIGAKTNENDPKNSDDNLWEQKTSVCEATATDKINLAEKGTCLTEECSKGVQSSATQIFYPKDQTRVSTRPRFSELPFVPFKEQINSLRKTCIINTCLIDKKADTYPRTVQNNEQEPKPFTRRNTDNGKFITLCYNTESTKDGNVDTLDAAAPNIPECEDNRDAPYSSQESKHLTGVFPQLSSKNSCKCKDQGEASDEPASCKSSCDSSKDPIVDIIKDITRRYSKKDAEKNKTKKCFKEIVTVLSYLLDTDDGEQDHVVSDSSTSQDAVCRQSVEAANMEMAACTKPIEMVDKGVNVGKSKDRCCITESSELPSSTDTATCVLNKIKKECEKYHQKKCKSHGNRKKCDPSSSTSNCNQCQRIHYCHCRTHKCKGFRQKATEKVRKKCLAYNLIIQTSDSVVSDERPNKNSKPLQHIVVKVPKNKFSDNVPFKEVYEKIEKKIGSPRGSMFRSRSCPNESEVSSECNCAPEDCTKKSKDYTVRDYLEKNRPDFVERSSDRQNCLKTISEKRANERAAQRQLLSLQLEQRPLSDFAEMGDTRLPSKFISEKEMKKHSEKIYKSLPEVVQKKEQKKKENIKKTNLLMANIFKKNLQKNTLRGAVNLSNYSTVIKM